MTSQAIIQENFPGAKCVPVGGASPAVTYAIQWGDAYLPSPIILGVLYQAEAWDKCVKHPTVRERFLSLHHGKLVKFLNEVDKAEMLVDIIKKNQLEQEESGFDLVEENVKKIEIHQPESFTEARDW